MHFNALKSCGLSRQKISYLKSLSLNFIEKRINPTKWELYSDDEIIDELIKIKGIGRWTAEMFLIFNLCRPDVFPADDLGLIKGICHCYNLKYPIKKEDAIKMAKKWKPYLKKDVASITQAAIQVTEVGMNPKGDCDE